MKLSVTFLNLSRPKDGRVQIACIFKNAMLDYCPSVEKLAMWQQQRHSEYFQAKQRGIWAVYPYMTDKEREISVAIVRIC